MKKHAILFDVYGTLISTGSGSITAAEKILRKNGSMLDPVEFYAKWKAVHKHNMCNADFLPEREIFAMDLEQLYEIYRIQGDASQDVGIMLESLYNRVVFPDTKAALQELGAYFDLVIASNTDTEPLLQNFAYNGLQFGRVFTSESLQCYKPDARFYEKIMEALEKEGEELIFIGDSLQEDVLMPKKLGMGSVQIDRKGTGKHQGDLVLDRLPGVSELLAVFS